MGRCVTVARPDQYDGSVSFLACGCWPQLRIASESVNDFASARQTPETLRWHSIPGQDLTRRFRAGLLH
jgi:hypothetical protein